jgi:glycosyltransferase involved in cell wall biosynthesis
VRLLHLLPTYLPATRDGGPVFSVDGLCRALVRAGHQVEVLTTNAGCEGAVVPGQAVDRGGVTVRYFAVPAFYRLRWSPGLGRALEERIGQFDLLHLHSVFVWPIWAGANAARRSRVPYVLSPRGMLVKDLIRRKSRWAKTAWINLVERRNLAGAAAVHVTSQAEADALRELALPVTRVVDIPNGVDVPPGERAGTEAGPQLLFLGRINWKKGLDRLVRALAHVPGAQLAIVGNDEENYAGELRRIVAQAGVGERVRFLPPAYGAEKWQLLRSARCFVLPSYSENFGNAVLEAMAAGCPVVVTPEVGVAELVRRSGAGLVTDGEPAALARALQQVLGDPAASEAMGRAGCLAARDYDWDSVARRMADMYRSILAQGKA